MAQQDNYVDSLVQWLDKHPQPDSARIITLHRVSYRLSEKDIKKSFAYYEMVQNLSDSLNYPYGKALAQINLGILQSTSGNFQASNAAYFNAISFAESSNATRLQAISLNNIGDNFKILKDCEKSRKYTLEAKKLNEQLKAWRGVAINYELLHQCDLEDKRYEQARQNLLDGMPYAIRANENYILSQYYLGFAKLFAIANLSDSANFYFEWAMQKAKAENDKRNISLVYQAKAEYLKSISPYKKLKWLDSAMLISQQIKFLEDEAHVADMKSEIFDQLKNKDSALFYYRVYRSANDSIFSENNKRNIIIKESEWVIRKKELENQHLQQLAEVQKKELRIKNGLITAIIIASLFAIGLIILAQRSVQLKKKKEEFFLKQKISETQMQLLRSRMNPHFIFNSLNSIENFILKNDRSQAMDYFNKFSRFIRSILDNGQGEFVPIRKDMQDLQLYVDLEQLRFNHKFSYHTQVDPELLKGNYKVPSLLVQPYIEYAIEHGIAHSEEEDLKIDVRIHFENGIIKYIIEDNGIGRKQVTEFEQGSKSFMNGDGLKLTNDRIQILNQTLGGKASTKITDLYNGDKPAGTRVEIEIKAF